MKRDWDVIREVMLEVEGLSHEARTLFGYGLGAGQSDADRNKSEHAYLLRDADYIMAVDGGTLDRGGMLAPELTWAGHDLLDTLRSKPVWEHIKKTAQEKGIALTFEAVKVFATTALKAIAGGG